MFRRENWEPYEDNFDISDGGTLYVNASDDDTEFLAGVAQFMDSVGDDPGYVAYIAYYEKGQTPYADDIAIIEDKYSAGDAAVYAVDYNPIGQSEIFQHIGEFYTLDDAANAVRECVLNW